MGSYGMLAKRAVFTETPVMVQIQELLRGIKGAVSLAQGVVYWQPPKPALEKVKELVWEPSISRYGADEGLPELREALTKKLREENKLIKSSVMVTAGANQERQILDGPMIINEVIDWARKKKKKVFMFKTDIAKVYDSVSWKYLDDVMKAMNFGEKWRKWIKACLTSSAMSVLVNGTPTQEFKMERGLRQGDPISPFLFTLIMEGLSLAVNKAVEIGSYQDLKVGKDNMSISHLFFADDAVFIGEWSLDNALSIIGILMCFKNASGLQVNYGKSSLYGIGMDTDSVNSLANLLGCKAEKLPAIFLGIPIGCNMNRVDKWEPIVEKFRKKLSNWKAKTLSIGGRLTIVSSILGGIPNYWLSMFPAPKGSTKVLENMRRDFFWGSKETGRPLPWVKWSKACQQRKNGGLGVIGIEEMNVSLLAKWIWRFKKEEKAMWVKVIKNIHGENGGMSGDEVKKMHPCIWKSILLRTKKLDKVNLNISCLLQVSIGNGEDTSFWEEKWHERGILKNSFPRLYALEMDKKVKVKDRINKNLDTWERRREIRDGREREEANIMEEVIKVQDLTEKRDKWVVSGAPNGEFSTGWLRECMECFNTMGQVQQNYWIKWVPKKHNIFIWRFIRERIPTRKKLVDMGLDIPSTLCPICERKEENISHLFFDCDWSTRLWSKLGVWWNVQIPSFNTGEEMLSWSWFSMKNRKDGVNFQAFVNIVLALCDAGDSVVMFAPYYFNAYMSFQMTGVTDILVGPGDPKKLHPDADWLEKTLRETKPTPKLVTVVNPGNPSGTYIPEPLLKRISDICKKAGCWLVVDNTYEYFMYDGLKHTCIEGNHIVNIFSFSKAYGMMGWRVGYIAFPMDVEGLAPQLLKIQDNIPICASIISQRLALHAMEEGPEWVTNKVKDLVNNRQLLVDALSPLGEGAVKGGEGAIYLWAKLPEKFTDDFEVVRWLAKKHGVVLIPGTPCGCPGHVRISFGGLVEKDCVLASERLKRGLEELVKDGMV